MLRGRFVVPAEAAGTRLDLVLADMFPQFSRSRLQAWLREGSILLDGATVKPRRRVLGGETVVVDVALPDVMTDVAEALALDVVFEDPDLLVINKPAGLVVHPAAGNRSGTLLNGLLYHAPDLAALPRAGIVHRLDKDTTGLLVVARTLEAHKSLVEQLQARSVRREYDAIVQGCPVAGGTVDEPIGRHPKERKRMAVVAAGKPAVTRYRIRARFRSQSHLRVRLETGRTHQIRVHMAHIGHPLVGDRTYGGRPRVPAGADAELLKALQGFPRQALHAGALELEHPRSGERVSWTAPLPDDMRRLIELLKKDLESHG
ncbi:MAG: 23S rRNA pseudouridine(1911/1915/1917) synthase RluD [Gammaproteobacteria bacterium]|nr:MAG: 23S rRNA pseudouridine(1911/1915/1917) synthase RluD [Gammaproteobacteria bacterium]